MDSLLSPFFLFPGHFMVSFDKMYWGLNKPFQIPKDKDGDNGRSIIKFVYDTKRDIKMKNELNMKSTSSTYIDSDVNLASITEGQSRSTGEYIYQKRKALDLTQEQLAEAVGVDKRSISDWENDKVEVKTENMKKLSRILHVSVSDLIAGKDLDLDEQTKADLDRRITETAALTDTLDERSITSTDIAISAFGIAIIAVAMAFIAAFNHTVWASIIGLALFIFGIVFIKTGQKFINRLNEERDKRSS